jgi:multiple sugar transport system ATP-binding protein
MAEVVLEQVSKTYSNGVEAVRPADLRIADGELVVLVGPTGSGKTTLLRLIAGLEAPTKGNILIGGRLVNNLPPYRRKVAMVFQRPALYPHLSVYENLAFALKQCKTGEGWRSWLVRGDGGADVDMSVREIANQLGLADLLDRRPDTLSGGQQQRVALGRAMVREPVVFLLDEPLSNLDAQLRLEMRRELHLLHRRLGATMIYVTHERDEAMTLGERVIVLDRGVIRQVDCPRAIYEKPNDSFVAGFIGWPPMNLLEGELLEVEDRLSFKIGDVSLQTSDRPDWRPFAGQRLTLGIRPEDVRYIGEAGEGRFDVEVQWVERLGSEWLVMLNRRWSGSSSWTVTARCPSAPALFEGATGFAAFDLTRAHLFDPATGRALCHGGSKF